jgi:hypothetical protein
MFQKILHSFSRPLFPEIFLTNSRDWGTATVYVRGGISESSESNQSEMDDGRRTQPHFSDAVLIASLCQQHGVSQHSSPSPLPLIW